MEKNCFYLFTDGSSRHNPGPGGWGALAISANQEVIELGSSEDSVTNNQMELKAIIEGLALASKQDHMVHVYTDSKYAIEGISQWIYSWRKNDWKTSTGKGVLNRQLWETLFEIVTALNKASGIEFHHVPSHVGLVLNERADEIATSFSLKENSDLYHGTLEDYPYKKGLENLEEKIKKARLHKAKSKERNKKAAYSYLSMVAGEIKIHRTWKECESRVKGVSSARFKKSTSKEDEALIIRKWQKK